MSYAEIVSEHVSTDAAKNIIEWLSEPKYAEYKGELIRLIEKNEWEQLEDDFFKVLEFGTAGRRGQTGIGPNKINKVTIGESTQALCQYAVTFDTDASSKGIVIACDTRLTSPELSRYAAQVGAANGFKTYIFDSFRATPELSFAVRHLGAAVGIVISASHNPPLDNGFKAYWSDGGQIAAPHDKGVLDVAEKITDIHAVDFDQAVRDGQIIVIGKEVDDAYIAAVVDQAEGVDRTVGIVYSPLHGAGLTNVLPALQAAGFTNVSPVTAQMTPDGHFPTVANHKPNPEEKLANALAVEQMLRDKADIAITNDPDADRIGVIVRQHDEPIYLTGNQSAVLAADYVLKKMTAKGTISKQHYIAKTIVTTDMLRALSDSYGVTIYDNLLIGFKYVADLIAGKESTNEVFVLAAEESFGLLKGDYARDKDGATGALPLAEYAAELKKENKTLFDCLLDLYVEHGFYVEYLANAYFEGATGFATMQQVMHDLREHPPTQVGGHPVTALLDYQALTRTDTSTGAVTTIDCVASNIIVLELDGDTRRRVTVRPSGTEPKLKFYIQWFEKAKDDGHVRAQYDEINEQLVLLAKELEAMVLK